MKPARLLTALSLIAAALLAGTPALSSAQEQTPTPPAYVPGIGDTSPGYVTDDEEDMNAAPGSEVDSDTTDMNAPSPIPPPIPAPADTLRDTDSDTLRDTDRNAAPGSPADTTLRETDSGAAPGAAAGIWRPHTGSYMMLKGGIYSPSTSGDLEDIDFGKKAGFAGEVAVGHYLLPFLAVELGAGYFQSKNSPAAPAGRSMLRVVPVVATGKALLPLGVFEPYGLFGIGGYISDLDISGTTDNFRGSTEITFGYHAGAGFNINVSDTAFFGLEGKYLWAEPEFGGRDLKLDGYITTIDIGFRF